MPEDRTNSEPADKTAATQIAKKVSGRISMGGRCGNARVELGDALFGLRCVR